MTKREAWKVIAGRVKRNPNLFLCVQIDELRNRGVISQRVGRGMRADIERVREDAGRRAPDRGFYALWPSLHPERLRFAKLAARGHARDYIYPEELLDVGGVVNELSSTLSVSCASEKGDFSSPKEGPGEQPSFLFPRGRRL